MVDYVKWYPGPTSTEQYETLAELKAQIRLGVFGQAVWPSPPGASADTYFLQNCYWNNNGGAPYFEFTFRAVNNNGFYARLRYNAALSGMLDPSTWFPDSWSPLGAFSQAEIHALRSSVSPGNVWWELPAYIDSSGLCQGSFTSTANVWKAYEYGPLNNQYWGIQLGCKYVPSVPERPPNGTVLQREMSGLFGAYDADGGGVGWIWYPGVEGENYSLVPQPIATSPDNVQDWADLGTGVGDIKDSIDNQLPKWDDIKEALDKQSFSDAEDTVTHSADVGQPGDYAAPTPIVGGEVFGSASVLPALVANPVSLTLLSKTSAVLVGAAAVIGAAIGSIWNLGVFQSLKTWANSAAGWGTYLSNISTEVGNQVAQTALQTTALQNLDGSVQNIPTEMSNTSAELTRIADALEAIRDELVGDPNDQATDPGIVTATQWASEAQSKLTVRSHGMTWDTQTGGGWEDPA